jgi:hypothetical protein
MPIMVGKEASELSRAFERYRETQAVLRGHPKPSLDDIEAALAARVELFRCLVETGWEAPEKVSRQIDLDARLVSQPRGAAGG